MKWETPAIQTFFLCQFSGDKREKGKSSTLHIPKNSLFEQNGAEGSDPSPSLTSEPVPQDTLRPHPCPTLSSFPVADELILLPSDQAFAASLNSSAKGIWELCNGHDTVADLTQKICKQYSNTSDSVQKDVTDTLGIFQQLNLLTLEPPSVVTRPPVKFVVGIEDKAYFHWQLPILAESLCSKIPMNWELLVVIANNHVPLSEALTHILITYDLTYFTAPNHPANHAIDFSESPKGYLSWNKIQPLASIAEHVRNDDLVCLLDTDIFLYQDLNVDVIPTANALADNWIIRENQFFTLRMEPYGVALPKLLDAMGCHNPFLPGGVIVFLTGATIKNQKFIQDCFRFTQILYLMGKMLDVQKVWVAEMPCFALALTLNGIPYEILEHQEFSTQNVADPRIRPGTFYHYYHDLKDGGDGAFYHSQWYKQLFYSKNFLQEDVGQWSSHATTDHEKYFFELANKAKGRLYV